MNISKLDRRNTSMDIIRIVAVFTVISVHFFLNNGFYSQEITGTNMYIACLMRTLFGVCVPLFIILTGYLMSQKTLSRKFYIGLRKTLIIYLLASIACMIFRASHLHIQFTLKSAIFEILSFKGAPYSWYIEMYIGLFLLIPFLNLAYNKLEDKRQKQILVLTLFVLTTLPSIFNIFNFEDAAWWANPTSSDDFTKIIPAWWISFYPVTYYFAGCYLREFGLELKTKTLFLFFVLSTLGFGTFNFYRSYGVQFKTSLYAYWYGFQPFIMSVLLFAMLSRIKGNKIPKAGKFLLWKVSDLALSIYLVSYIFDSYAYPKLNVAVPDMPSRLPYYFIMVPFVFICSILLSAVLALIEKLLCIIIPKIVGIFKSIKNDDTIDKQNLLFFFLIIGALVFAFWKCSYGFGGNDEPFYLTVAHRLSMGDSLFRDEWHLSQLSGFLTMPFVWLYRTIMHSTEGILLTARYLYVILHAAVSIFMYRRLKKFGYMSVFASILYFIFTPYDIMALSYNTMALDLLAITGILIATSDCQKKIPFIISGITFAAAVLCCPYLAVAYILYGLCVIVHMILVKQNKTKTVFSESIFSGKTFLFFTCGVGILAIIFLIFVLTKTGLSNIFANLPGMLTDPEHPQIPIGMKIQLFFKSIYNCHPYFFISIITYGVMLIGMIIDRNRKNHRSFYLISSCVIVIYNYLLFVPELTSKYYNAIMFPMIFIGLTSYILCENKPKKLFASTFILGIIYALSVCFSSNQYFYVIAMASSITNISSFIFLGTLLKEIKERHDDVAYGKVLKSAGLIIVAFTVLLQGMFQINTKMNHCFWETGATKTLTKKISTGPAKGIYTNPQNASTYYSLYNDLNYYQDKERDNILILSEKTWLYLALNDFPYGTFSAWISGEKDTSLQRLEEFYFINPDKIPTYIYIPKIAQWDINSLIDDACSKGYSFEENDVSYKLTRIK